MRYSLSGNITMLHLIPNGNYHISHSPPKVHHTLRKPPCRCYIRLQQLRVTLAATLSVVLARSEDV
jgi:hypothetical protein